MVGRVHRRFREGMGMKRDDRVEVLKLYTIKLFYLCITNFILTYFAIKYLLFHK